MNKTNKLYRFLGLQINGLFPFLYPLIYIFRNGTFIKGIQRYYRDISLYKKHSNNKDFPIKYSNLYPKYFDRFENAGEIPMHYFFQDIWAAKKVYLSKEKIHFDIGSRFDGFISHCLIFCKVTMLDIRPLEKKISGLSFIQCNCMNMSNIKSQSIRSISSLHAIEHFGLGRYGDPINPNGYLEAIAEIQRVVKKNGNIYLSVPIGKQRLEFNAHRIFDPKNVVELFNKCELVEFSVVDDGNNYIENVNYLRYRQNNYSCGLFHFKKK
jgi:hypothetical protein